jgi:hypothetical protein
LAPAEAIEGYEEFWKNLNTSNLPYLPYNATDENGNPLPMPQRQQPPVMAQAYMQGMQVAAEEMKMASGQYDASMGARSNETSGRAITARQREGDTATFHFVDNVARAIKYTGKILVDLIPKIYDTPRIVRILGEDGKEDKAHIDPTMQQAYLKQEGPEGIKEIYNPSVGRYDVTVSVGPSYSTKRQEAFYALNDMASRNPKVLDIAGDLVMKAADFPMAEELAERFEKALPPGIKDDNAEIPPQAKAQIEQLTQLVQQLGGAVQKMSGELEDKDLKRREAVIKAYEAVTRRLQVTGAAPQVAMQTNAEALGDEAIVHDMAAMMPTQPMQPEQAPQGAIFPPTEGQ